jgi:hypothetical protein
MKQSQLKQLSLAFSIFISIFSLSVLAKDVSNESFNGKWCGQWDGIYKTCVTINNIEKGSVALYQWQEQTHGKFNKTEKSINRINRNTLKLDNILFILNENNLDQATSVGMFKVQSRTALLKKQRTEVQ